MFRVLSPLWRAAPLLLCATMLFWAGNSIAGRALAGVAPPMALTFWRWVLALVLVTPLAWPQLKRDAGELRRRWPMVLALSGTGVATFGALLYLGLETTTALNSLLMQAAIPPLILLFARLFLKERATRWQIGGVALSLAGVLVVISKGRPWDLLGVHLAVGDAIILVGVVLYAVYSLLVRFRPTVHPLSLLWATFATSAVLLAPFYAFEHLSGRVFELNRPALLGLAYVAVFPSFLAYLFYNRAIELVGAGRAGQYIHLMPAFGSVLAVTLLGEAFRTYHAAGVVLIGLGIAAASLRKAPDAQASRNGASTAS